ncbi:hypothetical protein PSTT_03193 [Puccinia striiformis]|uniref:Glycoside hydrolase family 5 domain-containing protein n=1 Tax=Puccinia striiformis TaxID=27350 RepID=A0A2S4VXA1_9BASI|nr:hypothetical protein PSTT_03193 [Puccinia striiformis]
MIKLPARYLLWGFSLVRLAVSSMLDVGNSLSSSIDAVPNSTPHTSKFIRRYLPKANYVSARGSMPGFVTAPGDGHLYLDGQLFDFRSFNTPTLFEGKEFQARDLVETISAFGSPVTRTYTLHVVNSMFTDGKQESSSSHILGWDNSTNDWIYNEMNWRNIDSALDLARQHGVKIIIPIINQDYGTYDSNWVGNYNDLIRHRYNIQNYTAAQQAVDWFTDREMIACYKKIIAFYLNRKNTVNGIRIGDDQSILAFETGNEMNWNYRNGTTTYDRPPPANVSQNNLLFSFLDGEWRGLIRAMQPQWTIEIAGFIKSLAPKTLVMDGSYSRNPKFAWEDAVLACPHVDLYSYHYYGEGETLPYNDMEKQVRAHGKTFIVGEHGFCETSAVSVSRITMCLCWILWERLKCYILIRYTDDKPAVWWAVYKKFTCAGALVWSLRPHSEDGGFVTHEEGHDINSYHAPGFRNQTSVRFDTQEVDVINSTYDASYRILGLTPPAKPVPGTPEAFLVSNGTHAGISWRGAAWAQAYEVLGAVFEDVEFSTISRYVADNFEAGQLFVPLDPTDPTKPIHITLPKTIPHGSHAGWVDTKWCPPGSAAPCGDIHFDKQEDKKPPVTLRRLTRMRAPREQLSAKNRNLHRTAQDRLITGGWFSVRAIGADGVPGGVSDSIFLKSQWEPHLGEVTGGAAAAKKDRSPPGM